MTEQEQLREMGQIICGRCLDGVCLIDKCVCEGVCEHITAKELYNADYRKASEIRKETAREILTILYKAIFWGQQHDNECVFDRSVWNDLLEKFGMDVKE